MRACRMWLTLARRNMMVRKIAKRAEAISRQAIQRQRFR